jgi:hypothetical protein
LLFCIQFGLSMDYEVLMLSRMRECHARTFDNTPTVAEGLEKSAGLITSAAAIMVAVFSASHWRRSGPMWGLNAGSDLRQAKLVDLLQATRIRVNRSLSILPMKRMGAGHAQGVQLDNALGRPQVARPLG